MRSLLLLLATVTLAAAQILPGTAPLTVEGDLSVQMVDGINRWLARETEKARGERTERWRQGLAQSEPFREAQRQKLREIIGAVDKLEPGSLEIVDQGLEGSFNPMSAQGEWRQLRVRWPVFKGVWGEGVLLLPSQPRGVVIMLCDPSRTTAQLQLATELALQHGCAVLMPVLVNREMKWSGSEAWGISTNQPHREWIARQSFEVGRTLIGYEVQKVIAALRALEGEKLLKGALSHGAGLLGFGEGGLIALHASALEPGFSSTVISGYFWPHQGLYREPIYRECFGLLREFGCAELTALVAPRRLFVDAMPPPEEDGPALPPDQPLEPGNPPSATYRRVAAPGAVEPIPYAEVEAEVQRVRELLPGGGPGLSRPPAVGSKVIYSAEMPQQLLAGLSLEPAGMPKERLPDLVASLQRTLTTSQGRAVAELEGFTQALLRTHERARGAAVWKDLKPGAGWEKTQSELRARLWQSIGQLPPDRLPPNPRTRIALENEKWTAYDVMLDVQPDIFAWGWLLVPKDLKPGERRPVVVCQHGLEGLPRDTVTDDKTERAYASYKAFAARLCERGYIVYAPHNPYRGMDRFREINRRAHPLGLSLYSFIVAQHEVTTDWLATIPFVDPERIAFYGLSYGGKTAMRVPALVPRYCLSICSGDFNEWVRKVADPSYRASYMFSGEYEIPEWNLAANANYAEMAMLIAPRPFMVERGHEDGVAVDEWVGYEYAKVLRGYTKLGIPERTEIEWFDGPHTINGQGTFQFLQKHLQFPK